jgi:hypothetical protein
MIDVGIRVSSPAMFSFVRYLPIEALRISYAPVCSKIIIEGKIISLNLHQIADIGDLDPISSLKDRHKPMIAKA